MFLVCYSIVSIGLYLVQLAGSREDVAPMYANGAAAAVISYRKSLMPLAGYRVYHDPVLMFHDNGYTFKPSDTKYRSDGARQGNTWFVNRAKHILRVSLSAHDEEVIKGQQ